jgi:integrase/recombinase XerD
MHTKAHYIDEEFTRWLRWQHHAPTSITAYHKTLHRFAQWCGRIGLRQAEEATHSTIAAYVQHLATGRASRRSIALYVTLLKKYFFYVMMKGRISENPCEEIKIRGITRTVLHDILPMETLLQLYRDYVVSVHTRQLAPTSHAIERKQLARKKGKVMLGLIVYQGLSPDEICRLTTADVRLETGKIRIPGVKGSMGRSLPLDKQQSEALRVFMEHDRPAMLKHVRTKKYRRQLVFPLYGGTDTHNMYEPLLRHLKAMNGRVKCFDQLRASVIAHWLTVYDIRKVRQMAGHRDISATESYMGYNLGDLQGNIEQFHPF